MHQNNKVLTAVVIVVILLVIAGIAITMGNRVEETNQPASVMMPENTTEQKVAPSTVEDGEYYTFIEEINTNPEDTTITFKHVMFFEGEEATLAATDEGRLDEVRNGYYARASGAPNFIAPLSADASMTANDLHALTGDSNYRPVFLVTIENGAIVGIEEVSTK